MANDDRSSRATRTDAAGGGTLVHTKDLDKFDLPKDQPDPRGWDVRSADGTKIGKVEDLLFDTGERRIRYIEIALDRAPNLRMAASVPRGRPIHNAGNAADATAAGSRAISSRT